ncbi:sphingosine 1-phosphate receptor 3-like [Anneissia japonica]|uniref:sphingosine 1-phosphate receptor 3-like n=1 Tax=Anneissia japonica TaxID=1529436 RepID=UPI001425823C|nr:sphingosine 1-phosphate receptor 3-like [Anneissia japonica]
MYSSNNTDVVEHISVFLFGALCVCTFTGNILVIIILITDSKLHKKQNAFIGLLSLADMSYSISSFLITNQTDSKNDFNIVWCIVDGTLLTSVLSLAAIAIDRYIALIWAPFRYNIIVTPKRCVTVCLLLGFGPVVLFYIIYNFDYNISNYIIIVCVSVTLTMNTCLYRNIYKQLQRKQGDIPVMQQDLEESKKLLKTFIIVVGIFIMTWIPYIIITVIIQILFNYEKVSFDSYLLIMVNAYGLTLLNSLANPIIYCFRMPSFRRAALKLVCH